MRVGAVVTDGSAEKERMMDQHVNYPHHPGYLYDCPACDARCHCTPGFAECVFEGEHKS